MATISVPDQSIDVDPQCAPRLPASRAGQEWAISRIQGQGRDVAAVKRLFRKLHAFNSALDPRFALSEEWETHFNVAIQEALRGDESLCLLARETETGTDQPCGFALAAVHRDSGMWRYHEWVEVEALYVEEAWRGRGLAELLLARACEWADTLDQPVVQLYVTASNERAIRFYRHEGFCESQVIMRRVHPLRERAAGRRR